jgi:hypothetical protein
LESMFDFIDRLLRKAREPFQAKSESGPGWRESVDVCALADAERHLGHAIRAGKLWVAYDGMHLNPSCDGFRIIGTFATVAAAKQAIEENAGISWVWAAAGVTVEREAPARLQTLSARASA